MYHLEEIKIHRCLQQTLLSNLQISTQIVQQCVNLYCVVDINFVVIFFLVILKLNLSKLTENNT